MAQEEYVGNGFRCVRSQLAKTNGVDPLKHAQLQAVHGNDKVAFKAALKALKVKAAEYSDEE